MMRGRIRVKEQLARRGLMGWDAASRSFCKFELETIGHLFFSCTSSWKVWMHCGSLWGFFGLFTLIQWYVLWHGSMHCRLAGVTKLGVWHFSLLSGQYG